jgi:hypothetical protein
MKRRAFLRWAMMAPPIFILLGTLIYTLALRSRAYDTARQFLLTSGAIRQNVGTVQYEAMLQWTIRLHRETHREHEPESPDGRAVFRVVLFGTRSLGLASISMARKDDRWSVVSCELKRIGHNTERIPN